MNTQCQLICQVASHDNILLSIEDCFMSVSIFTFFLYFSFSQTVSGNIYIWTSFVPFDTKF